MANSKNIGLRVGDKMYKELKKLTSEEIRKLIAAGLRKPDLAEMRPAHRPEKKDER